jgi:hypothetical protein
MVTVAGKFEEYGPVIKAGDTVTAIYDAGIA